MQSGPASAVAHPVREPADSVRRQRRADLEILKGIAIVLVVFGHVHGPDMPFWFQRARGAVYAFHMPLFMFVSGYIIYHASLSERKGSAAAFIASRARRLLAPFFIMAGAIIAGKLLAQNFLSVHKPVGEIETSLMHVFFRTEQSPVLFIWYLFVLFIFSAVTRLIDICDGRNAVLLFAVALIAHAGQVLLYDHGIVVDYLYLNRAMTYFVFFMGGCLAAQHHDSWLMLVRRWGLLALVPFAAFQFYPLGNEWRYLVVGACAIPAFHAVALRLSGVPGRIFASVGDYSFAIYLLNLIFIGAALGVLRKLPPGAGGLFLAQHPVVLAMLAVLAGLLGPILVRKTADAWPRLRWLGRALR